MEGLCQLVAGGGAYGPGLALSPQALWLTYPHSGVAQSQTVGKETRGSWPAVFLTVLPGGPERAELGVGTTTHSNSLINMFISSFCFTRRGRGHMHVHISLHIISKFTLT